MPTANGPRSDEFAGVGGSIQTDHSSRDREVSTMAASIAIEQESGRSVGRTHPHNGYYAGEFATARYVAPAAWQAPVPAPFGPQRS